MMIHVLYQNKLNNRWYIESFINWNEFINWLECYEEDINVIYTSSSIDYIRILYDKEVNR